MFGRSRGGGRTEKGDGFKGLPRAAQQGCTTQGGLSSGGGEMTTPRSGSWSKEWRHEAGEDCAPATLGLDGDTDRQGVLYLAPRANRARDTPGGIQRVCADVLQWEVTVGWTLPLLDLPAASDFQKHPRKSSASQDQSPA